MTMKTQERVTTALEVVGAAAAVAADLLLFLAGQLPIALLLAAAVLFGLSYLIGAA